MGEQAGLSCFFLFVLVLISVFAVSVGLGAAARSLGQVDLDEADSFGLGEGVHGCNFAGHAVQSGFKQLALRVGLFRLVVSAVEIADNLGDQDQIARVDLGIVFLRTARPHGALYAGLALHDLESALDVILFRKLAHAAGG